MAYDTAIKYKLHIYNYLLKSCIIDCTFIKRDKNESLLGKKIIHILYMHSSKMFHFCCIYQSSTNLFNINNYHL